MQPTAVLATPDDLALSPFTGYTRRHWLEITEKLIAGFLPYFDPETGMPKLVGAPGETGHFQRLSDAAGQREAFGRSLTMVAFYTAATGKDRVPGYEGSIASRTSKGSSTGPILRIRAIGARTRGTASWGRTWPPRSS